MTGRVVAVIDVGSNSVRLLVARELSPEAFEVMDEERFDARLGESFGAGDLTPEAIERGVRALRLVSQVAAAYRPAVTVAAGTEALRRARNTGVFLARAERETGLRVQVLTTREEAEASFLGAVNSMDIRDGFAVDIGGGSLELIRVAGRAFAGSESAPLGAIYATERYLRGDPPPPRELRALRKAVRASFPFGEGGGTLVGVGGAVRNLARIARARRRYPLRRLHGLELTRAEVHRMARDLAAVPTAARRRLAGVTASRVDTLHAAATVIDEVMDATGAPALAVSGQGLREGLVWQQLRPREPVLPDVRAASVAGLALANGISPGSPGPVAAAAERLFDATRPLHQLSDPDREILSAATRLAGIGMHVDYYQRDRHAEYLVHSGDLHGFSHREIVLLAAIVRWAEDGTPDLAPYARIAAPGDGRRAEVLSAILGAAEAVYRRPVSPVAAFAVRLAHGRLDLRIEAPVALDAEVISLERQQRRLESVLGLPVSVSARQRA